MFRNFHASTGNPSLESTRMYIFCGHHATPTRRAHHGFSLIEVLISLSLLSLGIITTLAMQLTALRTARQSNYNGTAMQFASEMADIIQTDQLQQKKSSHYNPHAFVFFSASIHSVTHCTTTCSAYEIRQDVVAKWSKRLQQALPHAKSVICQDGLSRKKPTAQANWQCTPTTTDHAEMVIKIGWPESGDDAFSFPPKIILAVAP